MVGGTDLDRDTGFVNSGYDPVIIPTGGVEQNGPFVAVGKDHYIVGEVEHRAAAAIKNTLVAPVIKLVPQGSHAPPTGHMHYPGTLGLKPSTFEAVVEEVSLSLALHGFKNIILIADSGGSIKSLDNVVEKMRWRVENRLS